MKASYLGLDMEKNDEWNTNFWFLWLKNTGTWILIFCNFVPISLLVTLELVKFWQGSFMETDI
jgi:phospholipid-transporting ATPase